MDDGYITGYSGYVPGEKWRFGSRHSKDTCAPIGYEPAARRGGAQSLNASANSSHGANGGGQLSASAGSNDSGVGMAMARSLPDKAAFGDAGNPFAGVNPSEISKYTGVLPPHGLQQANNMSRYLGHDELDGLMANPQGHKRSLNAWPQSNANRAAAPRAMAMDRDSPRVPAVGYSGHLPNMNELATGKTLSSAAREAKTMLRDAHRNNTTSSIFE